MTKTQRTMVKSGAGAYAVVSGSGVLQSLSRELARLGKFSSVHVVTSANVWRAVGRKVRRGLRATRFHLHKMDDRETAKNLENVARIARSLVKTGADRRAVVIA